MEFKAIKSKDIEAENDWDIYWTKQDKPTSKVYDTIAQFYRDNIIKPALNHFIFKHFRPGSKILHAGCGSGSVDIDLQKKLDITALDISKKALEIYQNINGKESKVVQGSIFELPFADESLDGIYNLGVMEHFTEKEIDLIFSEFKRVLVKDGKIVIFWPPVYGLTVQVLDFAHFILNKILKRNIKLHPDEISRIKSKSHAISFAERNGFKFLEYYFGPKDIFTQIILVGQKK